MAIPTPPATGHKANKFMESSGKLSYFEDIYGKPNEDEHFDRFPDECENETDSNSSSPSNQMLSFFSKCTEPKRKQTFIEPDFRHNREVYAREGTNIFDYLHQPFNTTRKDNNSFEQYRIDPSVNPKQSIAAVANSQKKLVPRKYGMFSSAASETMPSFMNTASEKMDELLGADNLNDGFPTLEPEDEELEDVVMMEPTKSFKGGPQSFMKDFRNFAAANQGEQIRMEETESVMPELDAFRASDCDVEDNDSGVENAKEAIRALRPRGNKPSVATGAKNVAGTRKNKMLIPVVPRTSRYSSGIGEQLENDTKGRAGSLMARSAHTKDKGNDIMTGKRNQMTARTATLHKKAKKRGQAEDNGREMRLRNWKGELLKLRVNQGHVEVRTGEVDAVEYVRHY
ncbi:hypothetical protein LTR37_000660 [Vermiconidia calcicola]|uniref:Uncharacterized protein n=1 Tax=Vermiconidia calcicola TaxID=1690605 RepID=A0ACC3NXL9_9PEZI|nr:hypothetical protein LTR37_000660 [Vermiconidia calcicola]